MIRILITGAAGRMGTALTPLLRDHGFALRLLDLAQPQAAASDDEVVLGSVTDEAVMRQAADGVDLLLHLASFPNDREWRRMIDTNLESVHVALEAAHAAAVPVTLLASSGHAVGYTPADGVGDRVPYPRPDSLYGFAKAAGEALASLYADHYGMRIVSARILTFDERPRTPRALSTWVSPADLARLVVASLDAPAGHSIVWGVSANTRRPVSLDAGLELGYRPQDDAERYADEVARDLGLPSGSAIPPLGAEPLGGEVADPARPLGEPW
ncbi:NAD(P)-dependent oxidoreductase [Amnibacterium sp.]|uniref:NAD-dependent epimerase/dehydratase family protein n=1 Tax=Amnibacterium sp. TaxID=1872496 RepID=UPI0026077927|nr:NAD(P)-dependent oxidoreductase [Amnibacterium sp.]MCU1472915.1 putative NAD-dependent epimerase/dehydratase [Amnibacterium sp.]